MHAIHCFMLIQSYFIVQLKRNIHFVVKKVKPFHLTSLRVERHPKLVFFLLKECHLEIWIVQHLNNALKLFNSIIKMAILLNQHLGLASMNEDQIFLYSHGKTIVLSIKESPCLEWVFKSKELNECTRFG